MVLRTSFSRLLTLTVILACNSKGSDDSGATNTTTTAGSTSGTGETGDGSTATGEATEPTGGVVVGCPALCDKWVACDDFRGDDCATHCENSLLIYSYPGPDCGAIYLELVACRLDLSCEALAEDPDGCEGILDAADGDVCVSDLCRDTTAHLVECGEVTPEDEADRAHYCTVMGGQALLEGPDCLAASEALDTCSLGLTCEQITQGEGCFDEYDAKMAACSA